MSKQSAEGGQQPEEKQQREERVKVVEDEEIRNNPTYAAFIDKEIPAYDEEEGGNRYIYEYFAEYGGIEYILYITGDLNQDKKKELVILIQNAYWGNGDLLLFEEKESGELTAWEKWEDIITQWQPSVYYCNDGMFEVIGGVGISVGRYTREGKQELLMEFFSFSEKEECYDTYFVGNVRLSLYEDGKIVKNMEYECCYDIETEEVLVELMSDEAKEGEKLINEMLDTLKEERMISINDVQYYDLEDTIAQWLE